MMELFRIKRLSDGLFSDGGVDPTFSKNGKYWKQESHLTNHLRQVMYYDKILRAYDDCVVVRYDVVEVDTMPIYERINAISKKIREEKNV